MKQQAIDSELKKILQWHYSCSRVWEAWQYWTMNQDDFSPLEEDENIYNDIRALFEEKWNGWIPVTERLPEEDEETELILANKGRWMVFSWFYDENWFYTIDWEDDREHKSERFVDYWMPLPLPPKQ